MVFGSVIFAIFGPWAGYLAAGLILWTATLLVRRAELKFLQIVSSVFGTVAVWHTPETFTLNLGPQIIKRL